MKEAVIQDTMGNNTPNNNGLEQTEEEYTAAFISKKKRKAAVFLFSHFDCAYFETHIDAFAFFFFIFDFLNFISHPYQMIFFF